MFLFLPVHNSYVGKLNLYEKLMKYKEFFAPFPTVFKQHNTSE